MPGRTIFGDEGDSFFNIWVMNHVLASATDPAVTLPDGRIFQPAGGGNTFFWSDNLLAPSFLYGIFRKCGAHAFTAFWGMCIVLTLLIYGVLFAFFRGLYDVARRTWPETPAAMALGVPVMSYLAAFSVARMSGYSHIQNLAVVWLYGFAAAAIRFYLNPGGRAFMVASLMPLLLLATAPYYAVLWLCLALGWATLAWRAMRPACLTALRRFWPWLLIVGLPSTMLFRSYSHTEKLEYDAAYLCSMSARPADLWMPHFKWLSSMTESCFTKPPARHSALAAWGLGVTLATLFFIFAALPHLVRRLRAGAWRHPLGWAMLATCVLFALKSSRWRPMLAPWQWASIGAWLCLGWHLIGHARRATPARLTFGFLFVACLFSYGLALGPRHRYLHNSLNPCIWGFLKIIVPGVTNIRALPRLAMAGHFLLLGLLFLYACRAFASAAPRRRPGLAVVCLILIIIQTIEQWPVHAATQNHDIRAITPTAAEAGFLASQRGLFLVLPANPFFRNTRPMLFFQPFPDITLMNGYSAHSTPLWDDIMAQGRNTGEGSFPQVALAISNGCERIVLIRGGIGERHRATLSASLGPALYDGPRLTIFACGPSAQMGQPASGMTRQGITNTTGQLK